MALHLNGSTGYLQHLAALAGSFPCSFMVHVSVSANANQTCVFQGKTSNDAWISGGLDANGSNKYATHRNPGGGDAATKTTTPNPSSAWNLMVVTFASASSRKIYFGSNTGIESTVAMSNDIATHDRTLVGVQGFNTTTYNNFFNGDLAEVHAFGIELSPTQIGTLIADTVKPEAITGYIDGWTFKDYQAGGTYTSIGGSRTMTAVGGVTASGLAHPISRATDTTVPTMTGTMTSSAITDTSFTIDWSATTRSDNVAITSYETSPDNATWTDQGNVTAKNFTGKTASTGYTTYVRAKDAAGLVSTPALSLAVTTSAAPDTAVPVMTGSLTSASVTAGGFTLNWPAASDNVAVTGYEYSIDNGGTWAAIGNVLTKAITGLTASTAYNTKVRAFDGAGNRATPLSLTVTTSASSDTTVPTLAGSITVASITNTGATISWPVGADNVAVVGYEYSLDGGTTYLDNGNVLSKTLTGLTSGTAYPVRVRAYDGAGNRSTPALSSTFTTTGLVTITITKAMKNIMGGARAGVAVHVVLKDATTRDRIATKTGLTLGADGLPPSFTIVGPVAGTACSYDLIVDGNNADYSSAMVTPT